MTIEYNPDDYFTVSHSSLGTAKNCLRKFEFSKVYQRAARANSGLAAEVGKALHEAYQEYLRTDDEDRAFLMLARHYPYDMCHDAVNDRSLEAAVATLEEIIEYSDSETWELAEIVDNNGVLQPAIEVPFVIVFKGLVLPDGRQLAYNGKSDCIMVRKQFNETVYRVRDAKTNRDTVPDRDSVYRNHSQLIPYGIALSHALGQEIETLEVDYMDCYVDLISPRVQGYVYTKTSDDIGNWLVSTVDTMKQIQQSFIRDYFTRTGHGCMSFKRACSDMEVCASRDKEAIQSYLLGGNEPEVREPIIPWILCEIDINNIQGTAL